MLRVRVRDTDRVVRFSATFRKRVSIWVHVGDSGNVLFCVQAWFRVGDTVRINVRVRVSRAA